MWQVWVVYPGSGGGRSILRGETAWAERDDGERFDLFNRCRPVALGAAFVSPAQAGEIGLTEADLRVTAESRLRSARLYTARAARGPVHRG